MTLPVLPSTVGKKGTAKDPDGRKHRFVVVDEVRQEHTGHAEGKIIVLQKIRGEDSWGGLNETEFRLGYYIIGKKPAMRGKWVWGQFAAMVPLEDFKALLEKARAKGWI